MKYSHRTIYVDSWGNASDGTNMWDWSIDRLTQVLDYCWDKDIADLATRILKSKKDKLEKVLNR